jgi:hypothetical protein
MLLLQLHQQTCPDLFLDNNVPFAGHRDPTNRSHDLPIVRLSSSTAPPYIHFSPVKLSVTSQVCYSTVPQMSVATCTSASSKTSILTVPHQNLAPQSTFLLTLTAPPPQGPHQLSFRLSKPALSCFLATIYLHREWNRTGRCPCAEECNAKYRACHKKNLFILKRSSPMFAFTRASEARGWPRW